MKKALRHDPPPPRLLASIRHPLACRSVLADREGGVMLHLSTEQMRVVNHGLSRDTNFEWIDLPVGPQPIPAWIRDIHIDWMEGYSNSPRVMLKTNCEAREWENKAYQKQGFRYVAQSDDGRAEQYAHDGRLTWDEELKSWVSPRQEGFGGASFTLRMQVHDKQFVPPFNSVILRGPWHVGAPSGYVEVSYLWPEAPWRGQHWRDKRPWHRRTAIGGLFITEDLYKRVIARFAPTARLALVNCGGCRTLDPVRADWDMPKQFLRRQ